MFKDRKVEDWKAEIGHGLEFRKKYGLESYWAELEALFYNVHQSSDSGPNIVASTGDAFLSTMSVPNPYIMMKATSAGQMDQARIVESVNNELIEELFVNEEMEQAEFHAFLYGTGIIKIGYDSEYGWDPTLDFGQSQSLGLSMTQFDSKGRRIEYDDRLKPGMPWMRAVLPHDIVVPWGTIGDHDAQWFCHRVVRHIEAVKADDKYENKRDLRPSMSMEDFVKSYQHPTKPFRMGEDEHSLGVSRQDDDGRKRREYVEMWEIHDRLTGRVFVVASGHERFLRNDIDFTQTSGLPFIRLNFVPSARAFWTTPDAYYLRQPQAELADIALQAAKQRRLGVLKFLYNRGAIEEEELEKLLSADVGAAAAVAEGHNLQDAIMAITATNNNTMLYQDAEYVRRDAREVVGFSRNQMGEFDASSRRTATEANAVQTSSDRRMSRRQLKLATVYQKLVRKLDSLIFEYWTTPRWTEVMGQWVPYRGTDLKGDYKYRITFSSEPNETLQQRIGRASALFSSLANDPSIDQTQLRQLVLAAFNDPELRNLFIQQMKGALPSGGSANANIPTSVPGMSGGGGGAPAPQGPQGPPGM